MIFSHSYPLCKHTTSHIPMNSSVLYSSIYTRSMVFAHIIKAQLAITVTGLTPASVVQLCWTHITQKKSTDLSVLSSGSNGARTRDLSRVRRTLIPAELCFHICYYSPFAEKYNLNLKIPLSRAKAAWPTAAPPLRHSPPETETQSGSPGVLPDTAPFRP